MIKLITIILVLSGMAKFLVSFVYSCDVTRIRLIYVYSSGKYAFLLCGCLELDETY